MTEKRITLIPRICGKLTQDGTMSEPDIHQILDKWLDRHPEFKGREGEIRISRDRFTLPEGAHTEVVRVTMDFTENMASYDPADDADLYSDYLAEERDE